MKTIFKTLAISLAVSAVSGAGPAFGGNAEDEILTNKELIRVLDASVAMTDHKVKSVIKYEKIGLTEKRKKDAKIVAECTTPKQCYKMKYVAKEAGDPIWECYGRTKPQKPGDFKLFLCKEDKNDSSRKEYEIHLPYKDKDSCPSCSLTKPEQSGHSAE